MLLVIVVVVCMGQRGMGALFGRSDYGLNGIKWAVYEAMNKKSRLEDRHNEIEIKRWFSNVHGSDLWLTEEMSGTYFDSYGLIDTKLIVSSISQSTDNTGESFITKDRVCRCQR